MSLNRPMSHGSKRPRADEFYEEAESKRIKPDDRASGDAIVYPTWNPTYHQASQKSPPQFPPVQENTYLNSSVYGRREYPQDRRNSEDYSRFAHPSIQSPRITSGQHISTVPPSPVNRPPGSDSYKIPSVASSRVPSRENTPTSSVQTPSIRPPPPPPLQTHFSDNDFIRSASVDTATSHVAPMAPIIDRSASNSPRSASATLDPRRRHVGPSNLQTQRQDSIAMGNTPVRSSSSPDALLKVAIAKRDKAQIEMQNSKRVVDRLKSSAVKSSSTASHERKLAQATSDLQAAEEEVRRLNMPLGIGGLAAAGLAPSTSTLERTEVFGTGLGTITQLQHDLTTIRADLDREKLEREQENKERDRQVVVLQETLTKVLATIEREKRERENSNAQQISQYKQQLRLDHQEAVQEIQTQARLDREEDLSTHRDLLGQIKSFQSEVGIFKKSIASLQTSNTNIRDDYRRLDGDLTKFDKDIAKVYDKIHDLKDGIRDADADRLEIASNTANDVSEIKTRFNLDREIMNRELTSIKKDIVSLQERDKKSWNSNNTAPTQPDAASLARLEALEAFEVSATESLNGMIGDLTKAKYDLDVMQDSCSRVAYDAAREEAEAVSIKLASRIEAIENKVVPVEDVHAALMRIDTVEQKLVPDGDVKDRLSTCEAELTKVVKWVGQRNEDDADLDTLTDKISRLDADLIGTSEQKGLIDIVAACEESVSGLTKKFNDVLAELEQVRREREGEESEKDLENDRIFNDLEQKVTGLENRVNIAVHGLQTEKQRLNTQLSSLQTIFQQEQAARKEMDNRMLAIAQGDIGSNQASLRAELDTVKHTTNQLIILTQQLGPGGIQNEFKALLDRTRVLEAGLRNLEGRYNAITTTSLVQRMLNQVLQLLPADKDLISVIRSVGQHADQIRDLRKEMSSLSDKLSLNKETGMDDATLLNRTIETCKQTLNSYSQKTKDMESHQQTIVQKLNALQSQLGLDEDELHSVVSLRDSMENSMRAVHESIEQINGRIAGEDTADLHKRLQGVGSDLSTLKREQGDMGGRIKVLEEEMSKAAKISLSDPTKLAKRQHLDELRHTVVTHGARIDKLEATAKYTSAGADDSNADTDLGSEVDPPSVPRLKPTAPPPPTMKSYDVSAERSSRSKRARQKSSGSGNKTRNKGPPRSHSSMSMVQDSEEER